MRNEAEIFRLVRKKVVESYPNGMREVDNAKRGQKAQVGLSRVAQGEPLRVAHREPVRGT